MKPAPGEVSGVTGANFDFFDMMTEELYEPFYRYFNFTIAYVRDFLLLHCNLMIKSSLYT